MPAAWRVQTGVDRFLAHGFLDVTLVDELASPLDVLLDDLVARIRLHELFHLLLDLLSVLVLVQDGLEVGHLVLVQDDLLDDLFDVELDLDLLADESQPFLNILYSFFNRKLLIGRSSLRFLDSIVDLILIWYHHSMSNLSTRERSVFGFSAGQPHSNLG